MGVPPPNGAMTAGCATNGLANGGYTMDRGSGNRGRQSVKLRGRTDAIDQLRSRCLARVRDGRAELLDRLRNSVENGDECKAGAIMRDVVREVIMAQADSPETGDWECAGCGPLEVEASEDHALQYSDLDLETLVALEELLLRELEEEGALRASE